MNLNEADLRWLEKAGLEYREQEADSCRRMYTRPRGLSAYCGCCGLR